MRQLLLPGLLLFSVSTYAGICQDTWRQENKLNKVVEFCELDWKDGGIELVRLQKGCSFPGPVSEPCFILRSCGREKQKGASVFRASVPPNSYCITPTELEAMRPSGTFSGKAYVVCGAQKKALSIRLTGPDLKLSKTCQFPFSKSR